MPDLVRVLTATRFETNVSRVVAENSDDLTILDDQPTDLVFGVAPPMTRKGGRPVLPTTDVDTEATKSASGRTSKESK